MGLALEAELPVLVLVLFGGEDGFDDVPVLCYLAAFDTEEVVEGHSVTPEAPLADGEDEVPLCPVLFSAFSLRKVRGLASRLRVGGY